MSHWGFLWQSPSGFFILALLVSADAVFRDLFVRLFRHINIGNILLVLCMLVLGFFASYGFMAMLNSRVIKGKNAGKNRNQEPVLAITFTSVLPLCIWIFCSIQVVLLIYGTDETAGGLYLFLLCQTGLFPTPRGMYHKPDHSACMPGIFQGKQGAEGDTHCYFPLYLYYGGIQRIPDDFYIFRSVSLLFLRIIVLWALAVTALVLGGIIVTIFRPGFAFSDTVLL